MAVIKTFYVIHSDNNLSALAPQFTEYHNQPEDDLQAVIERLAPQLGRPIAGGTNKGNTVRTVALTLEAKCKLGGHRPSAL